MTDHKTIDAHPLTGSRPSHLTPVQRPQVMAHEPVQKRFQRSLDDARHVCNLARELSTILTGVTPPEPPREQPPASAKGMLSQLDFQAGELERRIDDLRGTIEHIRAQL